ncbi:MAG: hypothetical protein C0467_23365 [Planctomycetaceae bacterium]|nr:hypothetical protein [Planctomycetaceae bacterium]
MMAADKSVVQQFPPGVKLGPHVLHFLRHSQNNHGSADTRTSSRLSRDAPTSTDRGSLRVATDPESPGEMGSSITRKFIVDEFGST